MFKLKATREEVAELYGVAPATVDMWTALGMPTLLAPSSRSAERAAGPRSWEITRRELGALLNLHPDTITKKLPEGLAAAVVKRGPRGSDLILDARLALRWYLASEKLLADVVLDDFRACASRSIVALSQLSAAAFFYRQRPVDGSAGEEETTATTGRPRAERRENPG